MTAPEEAPGPGAAHPVGAPSPIGAREPLGSPDGTARGAPPGMAHSTRDGAPAPEWWDAHAYALDGIGPRRQAFNHRAMAVVEGGERWLGQHWLACVNTGLGAFVGLAVAAPIMRSFGLVEPSAAILSTYHFFCAQTPSHSVYIAGHQVCLCQRCLAIFSSMLLGGLLLALLRGRNFRLPMLAWQWWAIAMLPMAMDGVTQMLGLRESTLALRLMTGILFGLVTAWFALPQIGGAAETIVAEAIVRYPDRPVPLRG